MPPTPPKPGIYAEAIKPAIERLLSGSAGDDDKRVLQKAMLSGDLAFTSGERGVAVGGDARGSLIVTGDMSIQLPPGDLSEAALRDLLFPPRPGIRPPMPQMLFLGRQQAVAEVKALLLSDGEPGSAAVEGLPGVGKTTLVAAIGYDPEIADHFPDGVLWTSLNTSPRLMSELATWGRALHSDSVLRAPGPKEATERLAVLLRDRRMLLVVDDIWEAEHAAAFQRARGPQCALLMTTRLPDVADQLVSAPDRIYRLPVLSDKDAIHLLALIAPRAMRQQPDECRLLVGDLEALPLAIHVAGRLLNAEARLGWSVGELIDELRSGAGVIRAKAPADRADIETQTTPTVAALLRKSTDSLNDELRECFAYLGAFAPKPATFDLDAMSAVWRRDPKPIVRALVGRGLLEPVDGVRFRMHALIVAHARSLLEP